MAICGLNINLSAIQGELSAKVSGFLDLENTLTSPIDVSSYLETFESGIDGIKSKISASLPDIPVSLSGFTSLRDQISAYASAPGASALASITSQFGGLTSLKGMANINLSDLASSALSVGASFDPCAAASAIPNIVADASGALEALADQAPDLGGTLMALKRQIPNAQILDSLALAAANNTKILTSTTIDSAAELFETNIVPSIDEAIQTLPTGEVVIRDKARAIATVAARGYLLNDEEQTASQQRVQNVLNRQHAMNEQGVDAHKKSVEGAGFDDPSSPNYRMYNGHKIKRVSPSDGKGGSYMTWKKT